MFNSNITSMRRWDFGPDRLLAYNVKRGQVVRACGPTFIASNSAESVANLYR